MNKTSLRQKFGLIAFGILLTFLLLELGLRLGGFVILSLQERRNQISLQKRGTYRILCLGGSTTADGGENSYPRQLERILNDRVAGIKFDVINKGVTAITTAGILSHLDENLEKYRPDMVVTMIGINDAWDTLKPKYYPPHKIRLFVASLRIYKLAKLLRLHIINKIKESNKDKANHGNRIESIQIKKENKLKRAIEKDPGDIKAYLKLASLYLKNLYIDKELEILKRAEETESRNDKVLAKWGELYLKIYDWDKSEMFFKRAVELNPMNEQAYSGWAKLCIKERDYDTAKEILEKALGLFPESDILHSFLGTVYSETGDKSRAVELFKRTIEIDPKGRAGYKQLATYYVKNGEMDEAKKTCQRALENKPKDEWFYLLLADLYLREKDFERAEEVLKRGLEKNPKSPDSFYGMLALCYWDWGKEKLAKGFFEKAKHLRSSYYLPMTSRNYQKLKDNVTRRGIRLVCVQYPMRSVELLKRVFNDTGDIIFVDNEKVFKDAVFCASYHEYFKDRFSGDFGHCTPKGNRLLAKISLIRYYQN